MNDSLDTIDKKILFELDLNSRQSISALSKKLRLGRDRITYRMDRLVDRGVIKRFAALIDPYRLGYAFYKAYLKLEVNTESRRRLDNYVSQLPQVYWVAECDGKWDLIVCILASSPYEFHQIQSKIFTKFSELLIEYDVSINTEVDVFYKTFLLEKGAGGRFLGGPSEPLEIPDQDRQLLRLISENSRIELGDLAAQLDLAPATVKNRLKMYEENKLITGYRIDVDLASVGMTFFKTQVYTKRFLEQEELALRKYCDEHPYITHFIRQIGHCMIELEIDAIDYPHYNSIIHDLRREHASFVRNTEAILIRREMYKWAI